MIYTIIISVVLFIAMMFNLMKTRKEGDIEVAIIKGLLFGASYSAHEDEKGKYVYLQLAIAFIVITLYYENE
tara:strand:+ start:10709 stop:10924 length:216 start_codon:yes stop_codon:yes gene_type:complete